VLWFIALMLFALPRFAAPSPGADLDGPLYAWADVALHPSGHLARAVCHAGMIAASMVPAWLPPCLASCVVPGRVSDSGRIHVNVTHLEN
jgi:hypothetical protein